MSSASPSCRGHESMSQRVVDLLRAKQLDIPVVVGGVIPPADVKRLKEIGVAEVFGQEATLDDMVARVRALGSREVSPKESQGGTR